MANIEQSEQTTKPGTLVQGISIDSLKIRIPIELVKILDQGVRSRWINVNEETGDIDPDYFKQNCLTKYVDQGETVKIRFGIERQRTERSTVEEFLTILIPAKVLGSLYFEGIRSNNVQVVYQKIMSADVVSFPIEALLYKSACTDVDFKQDFICKPFDALVRQLYSNAKPSKKRGQGARAFTDKDNKGIEFNERKTQSYKTAPFLKLYQKWIELNTLKNKPFLMAYFNTFDIDPNICRIEATVKNKKHFRALGIVDTSLFALLSLTDEQLQGIMSKAIECNVEPRVKPIRTPKNMSSDKLIIYNGIVMLIQQGLSFDIIKMNMLTGVDGKTNRYRKSKDLEAIYKEHIKGEKFADMAEELSQVCSLIGWR
jgi:hypothetical protein